MVENYREELNKINNFISSSLELDVNEDRIARILESNGFTKTRYGGLRYLSKNIMMEYDSQNRIPVSIKIKEEVRTSKTDAKRILSDILNCLEDI